ncbi:MAG TPA: 16S rRNA (guanine(527)-N(7))-methyltransferase RsmG [Chryseolinea sp.]|nr:16S rRNA (guanine(527)-N(7))-methyltransferase RsmG [Chryseolinea sp.]
MDLIPNTHSLDSVDIIFQYFPDLTSTQRAQFEKLRGLYETWNDRINVISRKDVGNLYVNHVLHSLAIARVMEFKPGAHVLDVGTGGGFPGIPLAVLFPDTNFHLVDSIGKKITVVKEVSTGLGLKNVRAQQVRAEELQSEYDFVVSRAVTRLKEFYGWVKGKLKTSSSHALQNGILYLKGGDLEEELTELKRPAQVFSIPDFFQEPFFETKKVVHVPM